jgi:hypothetical protein
MKALIQVIGLAMLLALVGCQSEEAPVSGTKSHRVTLRTSSFSTASIFSPWLINEAYAGVSELRFCFKRLRFKKDTSDVPGDDDDLLDDNIDFNLGEQIITSSGGLLGTVNVPEGTYYRVEFDLEPECAGVSAQVSNDFGTYSSNEQIKVKFDGVFVVNGSETLELGVQNILSEVNAHNGGSLSDRLESISGDL